MFAKDPELEEGKLKRLGGSRSDDFNNVLANQVLSTLWTKHSNDTDRDRQVAAVAGALIGIGPKVDGHVLDRDALLTFASVAVQGFQEGGVKMAGRSSSPAEASSFRRRAVKTRPGVVCLRLAYLALDRGADPWPPDRLAALSPLLGGSRQAALDPLNNDGTLKLREDAEHLKQGLASRRRGVDPLLMQI